MLIGADEQVKLWRYIDTQTELHRITKCNYLLILGLLPYSMMFF